MDRGANLRQEYQELWRDARTSDRWRRFIGVVAFVAVGAWVYLYYAGDKAADRMWAATAAYGSYLVWLGLVAAIGRAQRLRLERLRRLEKDLRLGWFTALAARDAALVKRKVGELWKSSEEGRFDDILAKLRWKDFKYYAAAAGFILWSFIMTAGMIQYVMESFATFVSNLWHRVFG